MNAARRILLSRPVVFMLASTSFAALLGHFYHLWSMRTFALIVFPGALVALLYSAFAPDVRAPRMWVREGAMGGIVAALAYDLFRLPFVLAHMPLFKPFEHFGQWLLGTTDTNWMVQATGWIYHFSNGAALGIMFLAMLPRAARRWTIQAALAWAMVVEGLLLVTPYTTFLGLTRDARFIAVTLSAHLVFGLALGLWCHFRRVV